MMKRTPAKIAHTDRGMGQRERDVLQRSQEKGRLAKAGEASGILRQLRRRVLEDVQSPGVRRRSRPHETVARGNHAAALTHLPPGHPEHVAEEGKGDVEIRRDDRHMMEPGPRHRSHVSRPTARA